MFIFNFIPFYDVDNCSRHNYMNGMCEPDIGTYLEMASPYGGVAQWFSRPPIEQKNPCSNPAKV
jgi:hypothetical protein